jgi:uncharacterized membrane protein YkoI
MLSTWLATSAWAERAERRNQPRTSHRTHVSRRDVSQAKEVLSTGRINLAKAVQIALQQVRDGQPVEAKADIRRGEDIFEIKLLSGNRMVEIDVDAKTGEVVRVEKERVRQEQLDDLRKAVAGAKISVADAIALAQKQVQDGQPFEASVQFQGGKGIIDIDLLSQGKVKQVEIDAATGQVKSTTKVATHWW